MSTLASLAKWGGGEGGSAVRFFDFHIDFLENAEGALLLFALEREREGGIKAIYLPVGVSGGRGK